MTHRPPFRSAYTAAFLAYLAERDERTLRAAYELGREAVLSGLGVMDIAEAHHEALRAGLRAAVDIDATTHAGRDFLLEGLSAFEMVQRGASEARAAAEAERRRAAMVRRLSSFFADASLALDGGGSTHEILHLLAEQARELVGGACCVATLSADGAAPHARAASYAETDAAWGARLALSDLSALDRRVPSSTPVIRMEAPGGAVGVAGAGAPVRSWLAAKLTALDGRAIGFVHVFHHRPRAFGRTDEAVLVHLAQLASAAVERTALYA
ncbi:MAG TPA: phosphatase RsbU N-terminal domain-containing protein [Solirubrobacteraceae bacterium]|nr:phosphatase RsbU N-terminal domain-containing protein [Solirubrobacteraceae bacterium]